MKKSQSTCKDKKVQLTVYVEPSTKMRLMNLAEKKSLPVVKVSAASVAAFFWSRCTHTRMDKCFIFT